jgi:hypothetical protein
MQTVICIKWGTRYPSPFVNRLASMVRRNTTRPTRLVCFTDDTTGLDAGIETAPLPEITLPEAVAWTPWRKLSLWQSPLHDLEGDILFFDLDLVITGPIDEMFDYHPGAFCVAENWTEPGRGVGNTSMYRFNTETMSYIFDDFQKDPDGIVARYGIEQRYISDHIEALRFWPADWCVSFKHTLMPRWPLNLFMAPKLPADTKVVAFTGKPDPDEAAAGVWPEKTAWKRIYKQVRPTPWINEHWR